MNKYAVIKKCFANEVVMIEAEDESSAIDLVAEGKGFQTSVELEWNGDMPQHFWTAHEMVMDDEDLEILRQSSPYLYEEA